MPKANPFLPTADQERLLKALVFEGEAAVESWNAWRQSISVEDIDIASQRLLPLLFDKLRRMGIDHPDLRKYRSVARYIWFNNQRLFRVAKQILLCFAEAGIPAMPLKGLAVTLLYYRDFRLRAMNDLDILVAPAAASDAARLLTGMGWSSTSEALLKSEGYMRTRNAISFTNAQHFEIDLHWHVSQDHCKPDADDVLWRHSQPLAAGDFETRALSDTDNLFHACIHGGVPNDLPPIRWIVDSAQILRLRSIDWDRLLDQGREFDLVRRLQRTLGYLRGTLSLPIPDSVIAQLMKMEPSRIELVQERVTASRLHPFLKAAVWRYAHYCRNRASREGFFRYLQEAYGERSLAGTVLSAAHRTATGLFRYNR